MISDLPVPRELSRIFDQHSLAEARRTGNYRVQYCIWPKSIIVYNEREVTRRDFDFTCMYMAISI